MARLRKSLQRIDPGFLVVVGILVIVLWPFISRSSLPEGTDAELHIFRLHELSYLLRGGEFYPRWAPNFYHGYGYPIFNYYAPLTYYIGYLLERTAWFDAVAAVKGVFLLSFVLAGFGMYGFVRDSWGRRAGYVATAVFIYAPYLQYIDPHVRGVMPESFSFGAFAVALWALDRLWRTGGRWPWLTAVAAVTAVVMSHNLMGLLFFGLLAAWLAWRTAADRVVEGRWLIAARKPLAALLLGLGGAAIFWLPVIAERSAVTLTTLIGQGDNYDFRTHFLSLTELLAPSMRLDWGATEPAFRFNLGMAQWALGGLGIVMLLLRRVRYGAHVAFFAVALAVLIFLMLPVSMFVWEVVPFMPFFQFPWRLLGAAAAMLAVLAGAGTDAVVRALHVAGQRRVALGVTAVFLGAPLLLALPLSQVQPWPDFGEVNTLRMSLIENTGRWLGTTSTADYVPATVETLPARKGSVVANFDLGLPPDRVNRDMLPEGTQLETQVIRPLHTRYLIDTPRDTRLRLFQFDFPGWQVAIDGEPVQTELGRPEGFLVIPVPAGEHVVDVRFGSTPWRTLATMVTAVSLLLALVGTWRLPGTGYQHAAPFKDWLLFDLVLVIVLVFTLFLDGSRLLHYDSTTRVEPAQVHTFADFGEQVALLGYDVSTRRASPGDVVELTIYWRAQQPLDINYQTFVHVLDASGALVTQSDKLNPGDFPTRRWPTDKYVRDDYRLLLPEDLPPGRYTVRTGVWVQSEGWRLPLLNADGQQVGDGFPLLELQVE